VAPGKRDCLTSTTDVTDGAVGGWRAGTLAVGGVGLGDSDSVAQDGSTSLSLDDSRSRASSGPQHGSSAGGDLTSTSVDHGGSRS
jgi:hypothetical protein